MRLNETKTSVFSAESYRYLICETDCREMLYIARGRSHSGDGWIMHSIHWGDDFFFVDVSDHFGVCQL